MSIARRVAVVGMAVLWATLGTATRGQDRAPGRSDGEVQHQLATLLADETRFDEASAAFALAAESRDPAVALRGRIGLVRSALRVGDFERAQRDAASLREASPRDPDALSTHADALWSAGLFDEAEQGWREALALAPESARARHGVARALASSGRLDDARREAQAALKLAPREGEIYHTLGAIYERMRRFEQAAAAYTDYVELLPNKDRSEKAAWSRSQIRFLRSFGEREPLAMPDEAVGKLHTVPFRLVDDKVLVKVRVNGGRVQDFVLDTGSELTTISRPLAASANVRPITYTLSAGVGEVGLRGLQLGRIDDFEIGTLKLANVPTLIKAPALRGIPKRETESFSPLALGLSMTIDYGARTLTIADKLPDADAEFRLPMRHHRLSMVRGLVNKSPRYFVIDTGGEVISISTSTAESLLTQPKRRIALRVYGTSGWDRDAFLMPGVDLTFSDIAYRNFSVVVLNLRAPSVLLGFQVGGIVGHRFLSPYRVSLDLERSELRMSRAVN